mmetsp:Transcript_45746/g.91254  ORF Transcript_45746/g.91254 Transcript_45746/m.91254 type:complete len:196 (-) Transcript_45746:1254-1841(-)
MYPLPWVDAAVWVATGPPTDDGHVRFTPVEQAELVEQAMASGHAVQVRLYITRQYTATYLLLAYLLAHLLAHLLTCLLLACLLARSLTCLLAHLLTCLPCLVTYAAQAKNVSHLKGRLVVTKPWPSMARTVWGDAELAANTCWVGDFDWHHQQYQSTFCDADGEPVMARWTWSTSRGRTKTAPSLSSATRERSSP